MSNRHAGMRMNAEASCTYKRLSDGSWGCWTDLQNLRPGQSVTVTTYNGQTKLERLKKLEWTDGKLSLWSLKEKERYEISRGR